jgi:hypothetical protein
MPSGTRKTKSSPKNSPSQKTRRSKTDARRASKTNAADDEVSTNSPGSTESDEEAKKRLFADLFKIRYPMDPDG